MATPSAPFTPDYGSKYGDILSTLNTRLAGGPSGDSYLNYQGAKDLMANIQRAQTLGVDPSQLQKYVDSVLQATGDQVSYDMRRGLTGGQAYDASLGAFGGANQDITQLLQLPQEKYNQTQATNAEIASEQSQRDAVRQQILASIPGMQSQLGDQLLAQQKQAYTTMAPQIENRLNSLGLLQSGALPEANAKYQAQLESDRQSQLAQFGLNAQQRLNIDLPLQGLSSDLGQQQSNVQNGFQMDMANIYRNFQNQDLDTQMQLQKQLSAQALQQARDAQNAQSSSSLTGSLIGMGGSLAGSILGGPIGGYIGKSLFSSPTSPSGTAYQPGQSYPLTYGSGTGYGGSLYR